jgi:hypothetical protein
MSTPSSHISCPSTAIDEYRTLPTSRRHSNNDDIFYTSTSLPFPPPRIPLNRSSILEIVDAALAIVEGTIIDHFDYDGNSITKTDEKEQKKQ